MSVYVGAPQQSERRSSRKKLNHSSSFKNKPVHLSTDAFSRDNDLRHSTGSIRNQSDKRYSDGRPQALYIEDDEELQPMMRERSNSASSDMENIKRSRNQSKVSNKSDTHGSSSTVNDSEDGMIKVSTLIRGFQSQIDSGKGSKVPKETYASANDVSKSRSLGLEVPKRSGSKRKLSLRRRAKTTADQPNSSIIERLGISPFMGSANRSAKKSFSFFDIPSMLFDLSAMIALKNSHEEGNNRQKNISTGASAASMRGSQKKGSNDDRPGASGRSRTESIIDDGDSKSNALVESCPYFRNEVGDHRELEKGILPWAKKSARLQEELSKTTSGLGKRTRSYEILQVAGDDSELQNMSTYDSADTKFKFTTSILEPVQDDSEFLRWGRSAADAEDRYFEFEHIDYGALYYKQLFADYEHVNYLGMDDTYGPVAVTLRREPLEKMAVIGHTGDFKSNNTKAAQKYQYRVILRTAQLYALRGTVLEDSIPSTSRHGGTRGLPIKDVLEFCFPDLQLSALRLANPGPKVPEQLQKLDEQQLTLQYKVGVLYCCTGQCTEEDMYNNETAGPAFEEFLEVLGDTVTLKGFQGYRAQLDNKTDSTGTHSIYSKFHSREVMFHVTTMLPWTPNNKQQLLRKRHIGNDIVTVIFQEPGAIPFTPKNIRSHFQHVFIVVQVENANTPDVKYKVAVSRSRDVPDFGPPLPPGATFTKNKAFKDFLLTKIINAENAAHKSDKFSAMAVRTRYELLKDLALNSVTTTTIEAAAKFGKFSMSLTSKKKDKSHPPVNPEVWCHGALLWKVRIELEKNTAGLSCFLAISANVIAVVDIHEKEPLFVILCKAVLGWRLSSSGMKLYYNNGQVVHFYMANEDHTEMPFIINRLKAVTPGCETLEMTLRRNNTGQLGFHVFYEGLIAEVEPYGMAWQTGLRKGSRLLEVANHVVADLSHDRMIHMLKKPGPVRAIILPPTPDGQPRNYKVVRNMKRYSSLTSLYSMAMNNEGESSSAVSSRENLATNGYESPVPTTNQEKPSTAAPSATSSANPYRNQQQRRPPTYNESMRTRRTDDSSFSSNEKPSSYRTPSSSAQLLKPKPLPMSASSYEIGSKQQNAPVENNMKYRAHSQNELNRSTTNRDQLRTRFHRNDSEQHSPTGTCDIEAELNELERNITNTRKSIDAKFYRSLANSDNKTDTNGFDPSLYRHMDKEQRSPLSSTAPTRPAPLRLIPQVSMEKDIPKNLSPRRSPNTKQAAAKSISNEIVRRSNRDSLTFQQKARSPKSSTSEGGVNESPMSFENIYCALNVAGEPTTNNKLSILPSKQSPGQSRRCIVSESDSSNRATPPPSGAIIKGQIVRRTSEESASRKNSSGTDQFLTAEHLRKSTDSLRSSSTERLHQEAKGGNIVQSRVRTVSDVLKDQKQSTPALTASPATRRRHRFESYDIALSTPIRQPSLDAEAEKKLEVINAEPAIDSKAETLTEEGLPYKETTLGSVITTVETFKSLDDSLDDTFAKIDEAFGFRSYGGNTPAPAFVDSKDEKKKKRKSARRRSRHNDFTKESESSSDDLWDSKRRSSVPRRLVGARKSPDGSQDTHEIDSEIVESHGPLGDQCATRSGRRSKSEAEESLEVALDELKNSLTTMRDQSQGSNSKGSSVRASSNETPTMSPSLSRRTPSASTQPNGQTPRVRKVTTEMKDVPATCSNVSSSSAASFERQQPASLDDAAEAVEEIRITTTSQEPVKKISTTWLERPFTLGEGSLDRGRVRSEAKIMLVSSPRPWVARKSSEVILRRSIDMNSSLYDISKLNYVRTDDDDLDDRPRSHSHAQLSMPSHEMTASQDELSLADTTNQHTTDPLLEEEFCMKSLPTRGKRRLMASQQQSGVQIPLELRGLDLAALSQPNDLSTSSKEDLQVILKMLSDQLQTERNEKLTLKEQLAKAELEKSQLIEAQSKCKINDE